MATLAQHLAQAGDSGLLAPPEYHDLNLGLLLERVERGARPVLASILTDGLAGHAGPAVMFVMQSADGERETIVVWPGPRALECFRERFADVRLSVAHEERQIRARPVGRSLLPSELKALLERESEHGPEERAAALMDWVMERIEASRCALVPYESGSAGAPLDFRLRGQARGTESLRHVPRQILAHVARTRQPLVSHDVTASENVLAPEATILHQKIMSYMAVPVVFRGRLLAVCYVDRFDRPRRFSEEEQLVFNAFAYELATPLLSLLEEQRRREYQAVRDAILEGKALSADRDLPESPALAAVRERALLLAPHQDENLLILGETGVGKEHLARFIHEHSERASGPFAAVNVSAIPSDVFESELMGSVRGAFTDARDRPGRIAEAAGGTLFLDEIGDLSLLNQVKLLRFLQTHVVRRVGGSGESQADVRVIAATNRPVQRLVASGEFRADLLHRFAPPLVVPPLRERRSELLPRAAAFLDQLAARKGVPRPELTAGARQFLSGYAWPGNVRQLHTLLTHALLLSSGERIDAALLESLTDMSGDSEAGAAAEPPAPETWDGYRAWQAEHEKAWLSRRLSAQGGNVAATARSLGCPATTLRSALERHGLI